jgi:hypothetical protein
MDFEASLRLRGGGRLLSFVAFNAFHPPTGIRSSHPAPPLFSCFSAKKGGKARTYKPKYRVKPEGQCQPGLESNWPQSFGNFTGDFYNAVQRTRSFQRPAAIRAKKAAAVAAVAADRSPMMRRRRRSAHPGKRRAVARLLLPKLAQQPRAATTPRRLAQRTPR